MTLNMKKYFPTNTMCGQDILDAYWWCKEGDVKEKEKYERVKGMVENMSDDDMVYFASYQMGDRMSRLFNEDIMDVIDSTIEDEDENKEG